MRNTAVDPLAFYEIKLQFFEFGAKSLHPRLFFLYEIFEKEYIGSMIGICKSSLFLSWEGGRESGNDLKRW